MSDDPFAAIFSLVRDKLDLSFRQVAVLRLCETHANEPTRRQIKALAEMLDIAKPVVSRAADKLEEGGFIKRSEIPGDRRTCVVSVTRQGTALLRRIDGTTASRKRTRRLPDTLAGESAAA